MMSEYLVHKEAALLDLLKRMVLLQSSTANKAGVDLVADLIRDELIGLPGEIMRLKEEEYGDHLIYSSPKAVAGEKGLLLVGHMDTVFPKETNFNWFKVEGDIVRGPGVIDMKGGLAVGIYALFALNHTGLLANMPIRFLFNSDEEVGSPSSQEVIEDLAAQSFAAFVLECGGRQGEVVTGRKGKVSLDVETSGTAGHAAFAGKKKDSAILSLAKTILSLEELNCPDSGLSVNVGVISGGTVPNSVPDYAKGRIDIRYERQEQIVKVEAAMDKMIGKFTRTSERPVMEQTERNKELFSIIKDEAEKLGYSISDEFRSGVSDANYIANCGVPVVDGLGPMGGDDHSSREWMKRESLLARAILVANSIEAFFGQLSERGKL